jgi:cyclomaltodextrinase
MFNAKLLLFIVTIMSINLIDSAALAQTKDNMPDLVGLASPIRLNADTTHIRLADYFTDISQISQIKSPNGHLQIDWQPQNNYALVSATPTLPLLSTLHITLKNGKQYDILLKRSRKVRYKVSFPDAADEHKSVQIAGAFNNWNPKSNPLQKIGKEWQADLLIDPGVYQYKVVIDGNWILDPYNPDSADNNIGGYNSVMNVAAAAQKPKPLAVIQNIKNGNLTIELEQAANNTIFLFWNNQLINLPQAAKGKSTTQTISLNLPPEALQQKRSWLRLFQCNADQEAADQFIPLQYGNMVTDPAQLTREDKETVIMYFLMIDRFADSQTTNNVAVKDPRILPPANYMGGDLGGITQHLNQQYFSDLGINTIWLSPITQNTWNAYQEYPEPRRWFSGYHGYWPISNNTVEKRFGNDSDFSQLVQSAHQKNINILLDLVANHVHQEHPIYQQHPDWATPLQLPDGRKNIRLWDEHRLTTWFDTFLPTLDYKKPEVVQFMVDSSLYWIKQFGIDGFRHDATKHIPNVFWQRLTERLKKEVIVPQQKSVLQIGETYGSRELIGSYVGSGQMDGQFDFNLYFDARSVFALNNEPFSKLQNSLQESLDYYGYHSLMGNITGNHDMARFNSYASGALRFDENAKEAGWSRQIEIDNPVGYDKTAMLIAFIATIPGIPVLYYGDEIGMAGGDDPDNRRMMKFDNLNEHEKQLKNTTAQLLKFRRDNMALLYGDLQFITCSDYVWAYSRHYNNNSVIIAFNKGSQASNLTLPDTHKWTIAVSNASNKRLLKKQTLHLPPHSFAVLRAK